MESKLAFDFKTNQVILKLVGYIDSFKGKWIGLETKESQYLKELKKIATIESIGSSTRIEGSTLSDEEVKELLNSVKITSFKTREEQEVFGYYEALNLILTSYDAIEIKENHLHHFHKILLSESIKDANHRGRYKQLSNKVVANYPSGHQKVIFNTTAPFLVKTEMESLLKWTNDNLLNEEIHPLIIVGTFVYEFLSIHPYQDGNGRLSRLLTTLLLLRNDYDFMQYASMEIEIEKRKKEYYNALMSGQKNRGTAEEKIDKWIVFFLETLALTIKKLETRYEQIKDKKSYLNERQQQVLQFVKEQEPVKMSDVITVLKDFKSYTLKKDMKYFVDEGLITKVGQGRGTIYVFNNKKKSAVIS